MAPESRMLSSWELPGTPKQKLINGFGLISVSKRWQGRMLLFQQCYFWIEGDKTWRITLPRAAVFSITVKRPFPGTGQKRRSSLEPTAASRYCRSNSGAVIRADTASREAVKKGSHFPKECWWSPWCLQLCHINRLYLKAAHPSR